MLYKTIVLNLLESNPELYEGLRQSRRLLPTLNRLAEQLREDHLAIKNRTPDEALEIAVEDLRSALAPTATNHTATPPA